MLHLARILMLLAVLGSLGTRVPLRAVACCSNPGPDCQACCCRGGEAGCRYTSHTGAPDAVPRLAAGPPPVLVALSAREGTAPPERGAAEPERRSRAPDELGAVGLHALALPPPTIPAGRRGVPGTAM